MTRLPILLHVVTDGERCSRECVYLRPVDGGPWCRVFSELEYQVRPRRHPDCLAAEAAAREAEAKAVERGYYAGEKHGLRDINVLETELARIRGGDR